jgi:hypothetical protein
MAAEIGEGRRDRQSKIDFISKLLIRRRFLTSQFAWVDGSSDYQAAAGSKITVTNSRRRHK